MTTLLLCPGHVAVIKGSNYFKFVQDTYHMPAAICGFEPYDILKGIHYLVKKIINNKEQSFANLYQRCVLTNGNDIANQLLEEIFQVSNGDWRGIGSVNNSSLMINKNYEAYDAKRNFKVHLKNSEKAVHCACSNILMGNKTPRECQFFDKQCKPHKPMGPCMVSAEGACAIAYTYSMH